MKNLYISNRVFLNKAQIFILSKPLILQFYSSFKKMNTVIVQE